MDDEQTDTGRSDAEDDRPTGGEETAPLPNDMEHDDAASAGGSAVADSSSARDARGAASTGTVVMARPKAIALGVVVLLIAAIAGVVGYNVFTSDSDDEALDPLETGQRDEADEREPGGDPDGETGPGDNGVADDGFVPPAWSLIATLDDDIPSFTEPGGERDGMVEATWHGRESSLRVFEERGRWLRVGLQQRPNGSTTWVRRGDVELTSTPFWVRIDVDAMRLKLYENSELVMDVAIGIGTDDAPTPTGEFFVTFLQEPPDDGGNWGPFVMVTSGHSEAISDFQLSGDAITGIHGPLGAAARIGDSGAKVSKGCVRLQLEDLDMLRDVPAGSPIDIVDASTRAASA